MTPDQPPATGSLDADSARIATELRTRRTRPPSAGHPRPLPPAAGDVPMPDAEAAARHAGFVEAAADTANRIPPFAPAAAPAAGDDYATQGRHLADALGLVGLTRASTLVRVLAHELAECEALRASLHVARVALRDAARDHEQLQQLADHYRAALLRIEAAPIGADIASIRVIARDAVTGKPTDT